MSVAPFATQADMEARFDLVELVQLTDQNATGGIDADRMDQVLADASLTVLSYITPRYDVAAGLADTAVALLAAATCDVARYLLYRETPTDGVKDRHKAAMSWLRDVQSGKAMLDDGRHQNTARPGEVLVAKVERQYDRASMGGF